MRWATAAFAFALLMLRSTRASKSASEDGPVLVVRGGDDVAATLARGGDEAFRRAGDTEGRVIAGDAGERDEDCVRPVVVLDADDPRSRSLETLRDGRFVGAPWNPRSLEALRDGSPVFWGEVVVRR